MPQRIIANSFVSGEISPELYGRHDLKAYFNGAASLENFIVRRTGGIRKRAGTEVLFTLNAAASPDDGTLDNKFKIFTYFYDSDTFGLLVFRLTSAGVVQSKLIIREVETSSIGEWTSLGVNTGITATADLDDLNCKQVGDTLFFTRLGYQAFTCKITMAERLAEFTLLDNAVTVPLPDAITATAKNFYKDGEGGARAIQKHYALYGIKDGVMSKPSTVSTILQTTTSENGTVTPWTSGATITIAGTLDFNIHDYYILAKKTGMNYGKISEIYPVEQIKAVASTNVSNDLSFRGTVAGFNDSGAKFLNGDPALLSSSKPTIKLTRKCMALKATATTVGATTTYRVVTPHYLVAFGTASTKYVSVSCRPDAVRLDTMVASPVTMANAVATFTPFEYEDDGATITVGTPIAKTADARGNFYGIDVGSRTGNKRFGLIIEWTDATKTTDCLFIGGITISPSATPISSSTFVQCSDADLACQEAIYTGDNAANEPVAATLVSEPTVFGKYKLGTPSADVIHCTLWNEHEPIQSYCPTWSTWGEAIYRIQVDMLLGADYVFHVNGSSMSEITFTVPENEKQISSIMFHLGNHSVAWADGAQVAMPASSYVTATLYAVDGATEVKVEEFNVNVGFIESHKVAVTFPDDVPPTTTYRLAFSEAVRMRGVTINSINTTLEFVDDNIIPGAVTGQQDMLDVGDSNMDCALFDVYEQRSVFATSVNLPFSMWFSVVGDLYNFYAYRPQADDDAFTVTIPAKKASQIRHILASKELMLFTEDGVYIVDAESGTGFSYRSIRMRRICNAAASSTVAPIQTDGKTIFVGEDGRTVYELKYDLMQDSIVPSDRSVLAYHLTENAQIVKIAYQRFPDSVVWFLLDDGSLVSMTYMPEHEVYAWSHHSMAANASRQKIIDIVEVGSLVTGDGVETTSDILLIYETYDANGVRAEKTIVERMRPNVCSDVLVLGEDSNECTDHLNGDYPADVTAKLVTLRPESPDINTQGIPKNVKDVCLRLRRSGEVSVKPFEASMTAQASDPAVEDVGANTLTLFSGDLHIMPLGYVNGDGQLQIESSDARPCEILSAVFTLDLPS